MVCIFIKYLSLTYFVCSAYGFFINTNATETN